MKKSICLGIALVFAFSLHVAAQCGQKSSSSKSYYDNEKLSAVKKSCGSQKSAHSKSSFASKKSSTSNSFKLVPFIETSYQLGLCDVTNAVSFTGGVEKWVSNHVSVTADVQLFKTDYEMWCDDLYTQATYSHVIPAVKLKFDPGKKYKGFFVSAGMGYAIAKDRGTEVQYTENPNTGVKSYQGTPKEANWDFNSLAPNFSWGFSMKMFRFPVIISNTNYFAKTGWEGYDGLTPIAAGVGLKLGLAQAKKEKKNCSSKMQSKTKKECIIIKSCVRD